MKKFHSCIIVLFFIGFIPTSISQNIGIDDSKPSYNFGNWSSTSENNIGIGTLPHNTGKVVIQADNYWWDYLRLVPNGQVNVGYWLFHNPRYQDKLHIGWHTINPHNEYWNLTLTQDAKVGINSISPEAHLDVNGTILFHEGDNKYLSVGNDKLIFGSKEFAITAAFNGKIWTNEIEVSTDSWSDYVFENDYLLLPINEVEDFINKNKHLPGVPSEKEVIEEGINLGEMDAILLKKIEELTLYVIELKKELEEVKQQNTQTK